MSDLFMVLGGVFGVVFFVLVVFLILHQILSYYWLLCVVNMRPNYHIC